MSKDYLQACVPTSTFTPDSSTLWDVLPNVDCLVMKAHQVLVRVELNEGGTACHYPSLRPYSCDIQPHP